VRRYLNRARHYLVGDVTVDVHGWGRFVRSVALSLMVLPFSCLFSLWLWLRRRRVVVGIAQNGHANASHFLHDFEPFNRRHLAGDFGNVRVIFAAENVPLGPLLWQEVKAGSKLHIPRRSRLYRCLPPNRFVERLYLTKTTSTRDSRRGFSLPDVEPPSRGTRLPNSAASRTLGDLARDSFVLMQVQRPAMFAALQQAAGRRARVDYGSSPRSPNLENYLRAQSLLAAGGLNVVDLWAATGNPASLIGSQDDAGKRASDELQTWLFSNCELFLSGASGSFWIAWSLGRPTLFTDCYYLNFDAPISMQLPKLLWDRTERRVVTISELGPRMIDQICAHSPGRYEVISNTPEEIAEAVLELRAITRGEAEADAELQARVSQLAQSSFLPGKSLKPMPLIGQGFLRRHPEILA